MPREFASRRAGDHRDQWTPQSGVAESGGGFMTIARKAVARFVRSVGLLPKRPAIIMYHRVAAPRRDPWGLAVSTENFDTQIRRLTRTRSCLPLETFLHHLRAGSLPADAVAVTFDDGYRDNYAAAWPILCELDVPATLFLATGPMRRQRRYWWDELASFVLDAPTGVDETLSIGGSTMRIAFGPREDADDDRGGWHAWDPPRTAREATYALLWAALRVLAADERSAIMDRFRERLPPAPDEGDLPMSADEVAQMTASGLVTLGGHTHEHSDLTSLEPAQAFSDIARGKAEVESLSCMPAIAFAYPYGRCDGPVRRLVRDAGFTWACTTRHCSVDAADADPLQLPRITAPDQPEILID